MKKRGFGFYTVIWAICLAVFNITVFVIPDGIAGTSKFDNTFWISYSFITIAFIGQLICASFTFQTNNLKKQFYSIPLICIGYTGVILMLIAGSACMAIPNLPEWIGVIVCVLTLAFNSIAIIKAGLAAKIVDGIDEKTQFKTFFIKELTVNAQGLMASAGSELLHTETKRVYEAIRFSDPVSASTLSDMDVQIQGQFNAFADAVKSDDAALAKENANILIASLEQRNQQCKLMK